MNFTCIFFYKEKAKKNTNLQKLVNLCTYGIKVNNLG